MEDLTFSEWLKKYFYDGELKMMYRARYDRKEYSLLDLEEKYMQSRIGTQSNGCPSSQSAVGKIKTDEPTDLSTK